MSRCGTYALLSHTFSLLGPTLRLAHHSARCRIHASRLCSGCRPLMLMQNLNSFHFAEQCAISPKRYIDLSWLPRTISFRFFILNLGAERER